MNTGSGYIIPVYSTDDISGHIGASHVSGERITIDDDKTVYSMKMNFSIQDKEEENDEKEETASSCCGKSFNRFSQETSFHGVKHMTGGNRWSRRIAWLLILIAAMTGLIYQINRSVTTYFNFPTNTKLEYVTLQEIEFPKVTVCNINMFRFDKVTPLMGGYGMFYYGGLLYLRSLVPDIGLTSYNEGYNSAEYDDLYPGDTDLQTFIMNNGHKITDMIKICIFDGIECGPENFTLSFTNYGACYTFNPPQTKTLKNPGQRYGLSLILDVEHAQYVAAPRENVGFRIGVDGINDDSDIEGTGVDIATGVRASIGLRKQTISSLPQPYGDCVVEGSRTLKYLVNDSYTQSRCFLECETDYFMTCCGCRSYYSPGDGHQPFCSPLNLTECFIPKYGGFAERRVSYCKCPEACESENYYKTISFSGFPSRGVPETFYVIGEIEYYALSLGFQVMQKMEFERNEATYEVIENIDEIILDSMNEVQFPQYARELPDTYEESLYDEALFLSYDMLLYITKHISNKLYYDYDSNNYTTVNSTFYYELMNNTRNELRLQIDVMAEHISYAVQIENPSENFTDEEAMNLMEVITKNVYIEAYPLIREPSYAFSDDIIKHENMNQITQDYMRDNLARVDIYFESLKVEQITQQTQYEFFSVVCDLGGALGLFFGASLVAFVEAMDFWLISCCYANKK